MKGILKKDIINSIKSGDEEALKSFIIAEFNNIVFFANSFLHDAALAEDIAQETFISLWESRENLNTELNIRSYVFTIAKNKSLNLLREKFLTIRDSLERKEIQVHINTLTSESLAEEIEALDLETLIEKTYNSLSENIRSSFEMSRKSGLTYEEIAKKRGLSVKTIEYHINIALKHFRKKLKNYVPLITAFIFTI